MTDANTSFAVTDGIGSYGLEPTELIWRCATYGGTELFYMPGDYVGSDDTFPVRYRFDKQPPSSFLPWDISTTGEAVFAPAGIIQDFTQQAMNADLLTIEVDDYEGTPLINQFKLDGLAEALAKINCP